MEIIKSLFSKKTPDYKIMDFVQARHFKGFKRYKISNYDYAEAQDNLKKIVSINPKMDFNGCNIRLESIICSTKTEALAVYLADLRIGTIFFGDNNFTELKKAFHDGKISAACVRPAESLDTDLYLFVKIEE